MDLTADRLELIAEPGREVLVALLVLGIALLAVTVSAVMAWRGRIEGWSLVGLFGLVAICALLLLAHMPTRLVIERTGADVTYWGWQHQRPWSDFSAVQVQRGFGGLLVRFTPRDGRGRMLPWSQWPGLFVPDTTVEPRQLSMRIEAWRLAPGR